MQNTNTAALGARPNLTRRRLLRLAAGGFGYLALAGLIERESLAARAPCASSQLDRHPLAPKIPHFPARAKRIIFLFMQGAISQMDTFDYKPQLQKDDGKVGPGGGQLTGSKFKFSQHGQTGAWISELLPNIAKHVDDLCFIRSLHTDTPAHPEAVIQIHTGAELASLTRPSIGAWLLYGLGSENQDVPGYITINPPPNFGVLSTTAAPFCLLISKVRKSTTSVTCPTSRLPRSRRFSASKSTSCKP